MITSQMERQISKMGAKAVLKGRTQFSGNVYDSKTGMAYFVIGRIENGVLTVDFRRHRDLDVYFTVKF